MTIMTTAENISTVSTRVADIDAIRHAINEVARAIYTGGGSYALDLLDDVTVACRKHLDGDALADAEDGIEATRDAIMTGGGSYALECLDRIRLVAFRERDKAIWGK